MKIDKYTKIALLVILIATIIRIILALISTPAGDGCWHFSISRYIAENFKIPLFEGLGREIFSRPPLFHITGAFLYNIFNLFNNGAIGIKLVSAIFGSLSLWLCFLITKKLYNTRIAFYATFFLAFLPVHLYFSSLTFIGVFSSFFVLLAIYFLLNEKFILASIAAGLSLLSKYTTFFAFLVLIYIIFIQRKNFVNFIKRIIIFFAIAFLIALPWYIRNYIRLGNPVYPFLSNLIGGIPGEYKCSLLASIWNIFDIKFIFTRLYLSFFAVPNGDIKSFFFFNIPHIKLLLILWTIATIIFILPLVIGLVKLKYNSKRGLLLIIWILGLVLLNILMLIICKVSLARYFLPAIPALAIITGLGFDKIRKNKTIKKSKFVKKIIPIIVILIVIGFVSIEFTKVHLASNEWKKYSADFNWIKNNTKKSDIIFANGQCFSMNFNRFTWATNIEDKNKVYPKFKENLAYEKNISYIWINQEFRIDPGSLLNKNIVKIFKEEKDKYKLVYQNNKTGTKIYKVIK